MGSLKKAFRVATAMGASHHDNILLVPFFDDPGNLKSFSPISPQPIPKW
jgi:hypothetical protein